MIDLFEMWKKPKMVLFVLLTAVLYEILIFPTQGFTLFGGYADFGRLGVGIPIAFSFLFGPAAAWGAAIGNIIRDIVTNNLDASSFFGFFGNFLMGYLPYKLWNLITAQKPDLRSIKKVAIFVGVTVVACCVCGVLIASGLYWLGFTPFMPTAAIIALTNTLWGVLFGSIVLAIAYPYVSKHQLLYSDLLEKIHLKQFA
jgi:energy-coupling factor transport system substrate-specific component